MLPTGAGTLGRLLPPGAGGNLLRSTGFFDGAGTGGHVAVLGDVGAGRLRPVRVAGLRGRRTAPAAVAVAA